MKRLLYRSQLIETYFRGRRFKLDNYSSWLIVFHPFLELLTDVGRQKLN
jgi:hypothetical protein